MSAAASPCTLPEHVTVVEERPKRLMDAALKAWTGLGGRLERIEFPVSLFEGWCAAIDYERRYPEYSDAFEKAGFRPGELRRKQMEHFAAIWLAGVCPWSVVIDVAAATSPVGDLLANVHGVQEVWRQDLRYTTNHSKRQLGGDAANIDLPDASVDIIMLHNSWEHFEGESDVLFLHEAARLLRPGGVLCIVPVDLAFEGWVETDPSVWATKYKGVTDPPVFRSSRPVYTNDQLSQRYQQYHDPGMIREFFGQVESLEPTMVSFENHRDVDCRRLSLVARRVAQASE